LGSMPVGLPFVPLGNLRGFINLQHVCEPPFLHHYYLRYIPTA